MALMGDRGHDHDHAAEQRHHATQGHGPPVACHVGHGLPGHLYALAAHRRTMRKPCVSILSTIRCSCAWSLTWRSTQPQSSLSYNWTENWPPFPSTRPSSSAPMMVSSALFPTQITSSLDRPSTSRLRATLIP